MSNITIDELRREQRRSDIVYKALEVGKLIGRGAGLGPIGEFVAGGVLSALAIMASYQEDVAVEEWHASLVDFGGEA